MASRVMTTEAGWGLALSASMVAHVAMVFVPLGQAAESSSALPRMAAPPIEVGVDAVQPDDPASDEPSPSRVELAPTRAAGRSAARNPAPTAKVQGVDPVPTAQAPVLAATDADLPHFMVSLSPTSAVGHELASVPVSVPAPTSDADVPFAERAVDVPARLARGEPPAYPARARADGLEGDVHMELVVSRLGEVVSAQVAQPVGHGLDEAALAAARTFQFTPAVKAGRPVRARVSWTMQFRLR
jgi:TonB family protein